MTEAPPTPDQFKNILEYLGGPSAAGKLISGASDESDALRRLKADGNTFQRPLVVDWNQGKAGICSTHITLWNCGDLLTRAVVGENESEILSLLRSASKEA